MTVKKTHKVIDFLIHGIFFTIYGMVKYLPAPIGDILRYCIAKPFMKKLSNASIGEGVTIYFPYRIELEKNVRIHEYAFISGFGGLKIGENTGLGCGVKIFTSEHVYEGTDTIIRKQGLIPKEVIIGRNCNISANAIILKGVTIGDNAVIGAGAVVTKDVPQNAIVAGNPAKIIRYRE